MTDKKQIILHNDDVNTFDHVIDMLCTYCKHEYQQAEQCALVVHTTGFCDVMRGDILELEEVKSILVENNLKVTIE